MNKYNFEFDLDAIAQHYEFKTNYLDITMNREVAEFFAYTYVDNNGEYKPITDFKKYHPIIYRAGLDELIRYSPDKIKIVGFQAVLRPLLQQAMAIKIEEQNDNLKKQFFKVEELEQSSKKANEVYNKFHGGYDLLKPDAMNTLKEQLNFANAFLPQASVVRYCYHFGKQYSKIRIMLQSNRYKILDSTLTPHPLLEEYMRNVTDLMINWINKNVGFKPTFWI